MKSLRKMGFAGLVLVGGFLAFACSDDSSSSNGSSGSAPSYAEMTSSLENPTGTLSATNATGVADAFETQQSSGLGGTRKVQQTSDVSSSVCTTSGTAVAEGSDTAFTITYGDCCMSSVSCCVDGSVYVAYASDSTATYDYCYAYEDVSVTCDTTTATVSGSWCYSASGEAYYSVTYEGKTYTVTGSYYSGSGTLTITDSTNTYTCTYTEGTGTCTDSSGAEFTF